MYALVRGRTHENPIQMFTLKVRIQGKCRLVRLYVFSIFVLKMKNGGSWGAYAHQVTFDYALKG